MPGLHLPRRRYRRSRRWPAGWPLSALLAVVAGIIAATAVSRGEQAARTLGERRPVAVAVADLDPGETVDDHDVAWRQLPTAALPESTADQPVGRVVSSPIVAGEALVEERLAPAGRHGPSALAPTGSRLLAVATGDQQLALARGDVVDLLDVPPFEAAPPRWVARGAVVVDVEEGTATVAVAAPEAAAAAASALAGSVALVLVPPA